MGRSDTKSNDALFVDDPSESVKWFFFSSPLWSGKTPEIFRNGELMAVGEEESRPPTDRFLT
jgi:hypothetical protein